MIACALEPVAKGMDVSLPTCALLAAEESGLASETVATAASPFTLPKGALTERLGVLARKAQGRIDKAIRLAYGYDDWPL